MLVLVELEVVPADDVLANVPLEVEGFSDGLGDVPEEFPAEEFPPNIAKKEVPLLDVTYEVVPVPVIAD